MSSNSKAIKCPNPACSCLIIRPGVATLVQRTPARPLPTLDIEPTDLPEEITSNDFYWKLTDMMDFENIGFSHTLNDTKYLSCADCDLAPLGYHPLGQSPEYLIAARRVAYA